MKQIKVFTKKIKLEKGNSFIAYSCKDKEGNYYNVRFTKNSGEGIKEPSVIAVDEKDIFVTTNEDGYKVLVINGKYEVVEKIVREEQPLPDFE